LLLRQAIAGTFDKNVAKFESLEMLVKTGEEVKDEFIQF